MFDMPRTPQNSSSVPTRTSSPEPYHIFTVDCFEKSTPPWRPPAIDFDTYRHSSSRSGGSDPDPASGSRSNKKTFQQDQHLVHSDKTKFEMTREPSQNSLRSVVGHSTHILEKISEKDAHELQKYAASFRAPKN